MASAPQYASILIEDELAERQLGALYCILEWMSYERSSNGLR